MSSVTMLPPPTSLHPREESPRTGREASAGPGSRPPAPGSSAEWCSWFRANEASLLDVPWTLGAGIAADERDAIASSIQEFQLGESSEGRHLIDCARVHAERIGDPEYVAAIRHLIREEQRHARDLGRFMDLAGIPRVGRTWTDAVFRWLRRGAGLELSVGVLVTAEIIAKIYYRALRETTGSTVLRRVCDQILRDEVEHVRFQTERLAILRRGRPSSRLRLTAALHRFLFWGTVEVVAWRHRRALRAGGYSLKRFRREAWFEFQTDLGRMDPRTWDFQAMTLDPRWGLT